jgi:translation initiation factor 1 (eIF-1/SUI1)
MAEKKKPIKLEWLGGIKESISEGSTKIEIRTGNSKQQKAVTKSVENNKEPAPKNGYQAKIRKEAKGRSGHPVLVVFGFTPRPPSPKVLAEFCSTLKSKMGCGGTVEGDQIILQTLDEVRLRSHLEKILKE